jgi:hypothetical protein
VYNQLKNCSNMSGATSGSNTTSLSLSLQSDSKRAKNGERELSSRKWMDTGHIEGPIRRGTMVPAKTLVGVSGDKW